MIVRKQFVAVGVLVVFALIMSVLIVPNSQELALMQMKDKHFDKAREAYEKEFGAGANTIEVANNLSDLYVQKGDVDKAINIMQKYVDTHPDNVEARNKLGTLYQYADRPDDYVKNLEETNKIKPKSEDLNILSDMNNFRGDYDKQAKYLKELIASEKGKNVEHYSELANIQASGHDYENAIKTLEDSQSSNPKRFSFSDQMLLLSLLFDNRRGEEALKYADKWLDSHDNVDQAAEVINMLLFKGSVKMAEDAIKRFPIEKINASPKLLEVYVYIKFARNKDNEVYQQLVSLEENNDSKMSQESKANLMYLAAMHGNKKLLQKLFKENKLTILPESQVLMIIEIASDQDDEDLIKAMSEEFNNYNNQKLYPLIRAMLAVAGRRSEAHALLEGLDTMGFSHDQSVQVGRICAHYDRKDCAEPLVSHAPNPSTLSDAQIISIGDLYLQLHEIESGYRYVERAAETHKTAEIDKLKLKFAAALDQKEIVESWLNDHPMDISQNLLLGLFYSALNNKKPHTALRMAQLFAEKFDKNIGNSLIALAYIQGEKYEQAIELLRKSVGQLDDNEDNYVLALSKIAPKNPTYRAEFVAYSKKRLDGNTLDPDQKRNLLYSLMMANQAAFALPYVTEGERNSSIDWMMLYAQLQDKNGNHEEARKYWVKALHQPGISKSKKEDIGYILIDRGYKADAEPVFTELAENASSNSGPVSELLYLWGPRPAAAHMEWLERRYVQSAGTERNNWAIIIADAGNPEFIIDFAERHPESVKVLQVASAYFEALADKGLLASKATQYMEEAKQTKDTRVLRKYAEAAKAIGLRTEARRAYEVIEKLQPNNYAVLRETGIAAFEQADYTSSKKFLEEYINANVVNDKLAYMAYYYYGEVLRKERNPEAAKPYYSKAIELLKNIPVNAENTSIKVQCQVWSGDVENGVRALNEALKKYPNSKDVKDAVANTLTEVKKYEEARSLAKDQVKSAGVMKSITRKDLPNFSTPIRGFSLSEDNHELTVKFTRKVDKGDVAKAKALNWASYSSEGYDTILIVTLPEYQFDIDSNSLNLSKDEGTNDTPNVLNGDQANEEKE